MPENLIYLGTALVLVLVVVASSLRRDVRLPWDHLCCVESRDIMTVTKHVSDGGYAVRVTLRSGAVLSGKCTKSRYYQFVVAALFKSCLP